MADFLVTYRLGQKSARFVCTVDGTEVRTNEFKGDTEKELLDALCKGYAHAFGQIIQLSKDNRTLRRLLES